MQKNVEGSTVTVPVPDYAPELVTQTQAARALQRTRDFLAAIREKVNAHER